MILPTAVIYYFNIPLEPILMSKEKKKSLKQQLWNIANTLRGKMGADEFRNYILGFIFYKYLSDKMKHYANEILSEDDIDYLNINENTDQGIQYIEFIKEKSIDTLGYFLKPSELFCQISMRGNGDASSGNDPFILEDLSNILRYIEQPIEGKKSKHYFEHLFEDLDLNATKLGRTKEAKNALIANVLSHINHIDFDLKNQSLYTQEHDILGDAYEYLIEQFASGSGKKSGEFYTPQQVSKILAKLVTIGKTQLKSAYDPTCGSGSLLLRIAKEVDNISNFYGQELNRTTYNLARMNMIIHDIDYQQFDLRQEDTLEHPQHIEHRFEAIVANPPFSAHWSADPLHKKDQRFSQYGKLAPKTKADFAFIQHIIYQLDDNGTMAIVLPHGVLFRGAAEAHIRKYLLKDKNYLDAVIGLPANIFYSTSIATCILVFKKCREDNKHILFIDASREFKKVKAQNIITDSHIDKIINTFINRTSLNKYSYLATLDEVRDNDYNLNIPRYVDTFEEENIDLDTIAHTLKALDNEMKVTDSELKKFCTELNISTPF